MGERLYGRSSTRFAELWQALPPEARRIYSELEPTKQEENSQSQRRENSLALEVLAALCNKGYDVAATTLIPRHSPHLRGSSLEHTIHPHAIEVRNDRRLRAVMSPVITELIVTGVDLIARYVKSGWPLSLDTYRPGFIMLRTAALFEPEAVHSVGRDLDKTFACRAKEYPIIANFLPASLAWGCDPINISAGDLIYMNFWRNAPRDLNWVFHSNHVLGYNAAPRQGRRLVEMTPDRARKEIMRTADQIRESLIEQTTRKAKEGHANGAWIAATYLKLQNGINYLDGCWTKLARPQARKLRDFIVFARHETQCLDGQEKRWLHANMSSVENTLTRRYQLHTPAEYSLRRAEPYCRYTLRSLPS